MFIYGEREQDESGWNFTRNLEYEKLSYAAGFGACFGGYESIFRG